MGVCRKYKSTVLGGVVAIALAYILNIVAIYTIYCGPKVDSLWVNAIYGVKESYATSIEGSKVVFVAGSSGHYGFNAEWAEKELGVPVVNLATHAGLGDYYFERAKRSLSPGDLLLFAPEYKFYTSSERIPSVQSDYLVNFDKSYLRSLDPQDQFTIVQSYLNPVKQLLKHIDYIRKRAKDLRARGFVDTLNQNGDESKNVAYNGRLVTPVSLEGRLQQDTYYMQKMAAFIDWCQKNDVTVLVSWPGTLEDPANSDESSQRLIDQLNDYWMNLEIGVLGQPGDFFYPLELIYDTQYHLNVDGVTRRTDSLVEMLQQNADYQNWQGVE